MLNFSILFYQHVATEPTFQLNSKYLCETESLQGHKIGPLQKIVVLTILSISDNAYTVLIILSFISSLSEIRQQLSFVTRLQRSSCF